MKGSISKRKGGVHMVLIRVTLLRNYEMVMEI